jgi:glycosyltransferase involved in cell wall biosynthesis
MHKIAHIMPWPTVGGVEVATLRIAKSLDPALFQNIAFCIDGPTQVRDYFAESGFETGSYSPADFSVRQSRSFLQSSVQLAAELRRKKIDIVHCADLRAAFFAGVAGRLARCRVACHIRARFDVSGREALLLRAVDKFLFVSQDTWQQFGFQVPNHRGAVLYDGFDVVRTVDARAAHSVRTEFRIAPDATIVGMVARVAAQKDYQTLARAAKRVVAVNPNVVFLIVGDHSGTEAYRDHYHKVRQILEDLEMTSYFVFTDFRTDVARLISAMDIFVLSTHMEGLPLAIIEAMAHGKPVVATAVDGIPEIILDQKTGLLFPHEDDQRLADHVLALVRDPSMRMSIGKMGEDYVQANFSQAGFAERMTRAYYDILANRPKPSAKDIETNRSQI